MNKLQVLSEVATLKSGFRFNNPTDLRQSGIRSSFLHYMNVFGFALGRRGEFFCLKEVELKGPRAAKVGHTIKGTQNESFIIDIL